MHLIEDIGIGCIFGNINCQSDLKYDTDNNWFGFLGDFSGGYDYITISLDFKTSEMILYKDGIELDRTILGIEYLESGDIFKNEIPFAIGMVCGGAPWQVQYGKFDLYACRLYTRVLTDEEISQNYTATTKYHNDLVNSVTE